MSNPPRVDAISTVALERSRALLRQALLGTSTDPDAAASIGDAAIAKDVAPQAAALAASAARLASTANQRVPRALATADLSLHATSLHATWWQLGHEIADGLLAPTASRHPVALLAGAASVGGLLAQILLMRPIHTSRAGTSGTRSHVLRRVFSVALAVTPPSTWRALARWLVRAAARPPFDATGGANVRV